MGNLIREHDWASTPLGPTATWPQSIRSMVDMLLPSDFPMVLLWGRDLIQIYNDGYREIMAAKHPAGLGQPTRECWPEVWDINEPIYERVWAGESVSFRNRLYPLVRRGYVENVWLTLAYSPVRDESGEIAGVLVTLIDTSAQVLAVAALSESEERYRTLFNAIDEGFCTIEVIFDDAGRAIDYLILDVNPVYERITGLVDAQGKRVRELVPDLEEHWFEMYGRIARTGTPERFEQRAAALGRWFSVFALRIGEPHEHRLAVLFQDISERKQGELERERLLAELETQRVELRNRVALSTRNLRSLSRKLLNVQEDERRHLSRELHDEIGQSLTALRIRLAAVRDAPDRNLDAAERILNDLFTRVNQLSVDLRPPVLDTLGLLPAVLWHIERYQADTGVKVDVRHLNVNRRLPPEVETVAFRVIQEGLTNIARHSGSPTAELQLMGEDVLTVIIRDKGRGFDADAVRESGGLSGMRERLDLVQGEFTIETAPEGGTTIAIEIPLSREASEGKERADGDHYRSR